MLVTSGGGGPTSECLIEKMSSHLNVGYWWLQGLTLECLHVKRSPECWLLVVVGTHA